LLCSMSPGRLPNRGQTRGPFRDREITLNHDKYAATANKTINAVAISI